MRFVGFLYCSDESCVVYCDGLVDYGMQHSFLKSGKTYSLDGCVESVASCPRFEVTGLVVRIMKLETGLFVLFGN